MPIGVADLLGLVRDVEGVDTNTVTANKARPGGRKFHFVQAAANTSRVSISRRSHINATSLISEIDIALGVLQHLGELGDSDRRRGMNARCDDASVHGINNFQRVGCVGGDHFQDVVKASLLVSGIDALWRLTDIEAHLPFEA